MELNQLFESIQKNSISLLGAITIISFIINIVQAYTKQSASHILDGIYHICYRRIRRNEKVALSNEDLMSTLYDIRTQSVSGLKTLGIRRSYGHYDARNKDGILYRYFQRQYKLLMKIKEKAPNLFRKGQKGD